MWPIVFYVVKTTPCLTLVLCVLVLKNKTPRSDSILSQSAKVELSQSLEGASAKFINTQAE